MKQVNTQIQVYGYFRDPFENKIQGQLINKFGSQCSNQIWNQIWSQFWCQLNDQLGSCLMAQLRITVKKGGVCKVKNI